MEQAIVDWPAVIERLEAHIDHERRRAAACEGKHGFATAVQAHEHGRGRLWAEQAHVYHCPFCSLFHVSSNLKPKGTGFLRRQIRFASRKRR